MLEIAWEAFEHAGLPVTALRESPTGVFVGSGINDYGEVSIAADPLAEDPYAITGNGLCFCAGRISFALGLRGPSLNVDTACSSSLVAVHLGLPEPAAGRVPDGAGRGRAPDALPADVPAAVSDPGVFPERDLPTVRGSGRRIRARRGLRRGGAQAAARRGGGRRSDPRGDPRDRHQPRRAEQRPDRAQRSGPAGAVAGGATGCGRGAARNRCDRGPRHGHGARRSDRGRGDRGGVRRRPRRGGPAAARIGQGERGPSRGRGRDRRAAQDDARAAARRAPGAAELRAPELADRLGRPGRGGRVDHPTVARGRGAAAGRRELVRAQRHERPRRARAGAAGRGRTNAAGTARRARTGANGAARGAHGPLRAAVVRPLPRGAAGRRGSDGAVARPRRRARSGRPLLHGRRAAGAPVASPGRVGRDAGRAQGGGCGRLPATRTRPRSCTGSCRSRRVVRCSSSPDKAASPSAWRRRCWAWVSSAWSSRSATPRSDRCSTGRSSTSSSPTRRPRECSGSQSSNRCCSRSRSRWRDSSWPTGSAQVRWSGTASVRWRRPTSRARSTCPPRAAWSQGAARCSVGWRAPASSPSPRSAARKRTPSCGSRGAAWRSRGTTARDRACWAGRRTRSTTCSRVWRRRTCSAAGSLRASLPTHQGSSRSSTRCAKPSTACVRAPARCRSIRPDPPRS